MGCLLRLETGWSVDHHSEASRASRDTSRDRFRSTGSRFPWTRPSLRFRARFVFHAHASHSAIALTRSRSSCFNALSPPVSPPSPSLSPSSPLTHCLPHAASNNSAVHVVFQVCLQCCRYHAACVTVGQGIGDKLRIVALSHTQQQRASSYHSGGRAASAEHAPLTLPPQSLSWSASGDIHEC
jgi:hypothetical protein